ncbi:aromatic alcohol reductase [Variovorax boronicumulans]|uniref:aromatic alcohol reductase n=1 Tax=Variovorax boronicumulans TaxID=436515 RepID=UPI001C57C5FE
MDHRSPTKILVVGAGELGLSVIRALAARSDPMGARLTALLRPEASSPSLARRALLAELARLKVATVYADIAGTSASALGEVFRPFQTVVNCTGFVGGPGTQLKLTAAALEAGVARYVPWQFGVDYDAIETGSGGGIFDEQIAVRALLRAQQRTRWTIVSTGMFTSFLFEPAFGVANLQEMSVHALGSWDTRVTVTTPRDIGTLTADILFTHPAGTDEIYFTAGETLSYGRLADLVEQALHTTVKRKEWTIESLRHALAQQPDDVMRKYRLAFAEEGGVAWDMDSTYNARHGIPTEDVAAFLRGRTLAA